MVKVALSGYWSGGIVASVTEYNAGDLDLIPPMGRVFAGLLASL